MIDELELEKTNAKAIVGLGINAEVYTEDMPKSAKDINEAAHEIVSFAIDTWVDDGVRPDDEDETAAQVGADIEEIFTVAGIEVDDEGNVEIGEQPEVEVKKKGEDWVVEIDGEEAGEDDDDAEDDDEDNDGDEDDVVFDIDEVVKEGYADLTDASKLKAIKALKLDADSDEDYNTLVAIEEFENEQDKPSTKVLNLIESLLPEDEQEGDEEDADDDEDQDDESDEEAGDGESEGDDEPWTEDDLKALDKDDLKALAGQFDVEIPKRVTSAGITRMIDGILAAQEEGEEEDGDAEEGEVEGYEEPYEGYDTAKLAEIKAVINEDDRPLEDIEYLLEYEQQREKPRKTVVTAIEKRIAEFSDDEAGEEVDAAVDRDDAADERKAKKGRSKSKKAAASDDDVPEGLNGAFVKSKLVEKTVRESGLSEPSEFTDEMPELPADIDAVDHADLSNLLLAFQNAYSTAIWKASLAYISSDIYEEIANYLRDQAILNTEETNDSKRKADAGSDAQYLAWRGKFKESYHEYVAFRDLARTIEGKIKVLSRVGGFKDDEQAAGDRSARSKPKPAAKPAAPKQEEATEEAPAKKTTAKRTTRSTAKKAPAKSAPAKTSGTKRRVRR